jgi:hypothetical protein
MSGNFNGQYSQAGRHPGWLLRPAVGNRALQWWQGNSKGVGECPHDGGRDRDQGGDRGEDWSRIATYCVMVVVRNQALLSHSHSSD